MNTASQVRTGPVLVGSMLLAVTLAFMFAIDAAGAPTKNSKKTSPPARTANATPAAGTTNPTAGHDKDKHHKKHKKHHKKHNKKTSALEQRIQQDVQNVEHDQQMTRRAEAALTSDIKRLRSK